MKRYSESMHIARVSYYKMCYLRQFVNINAKTYVFSLGISDLTFFVLKNIDISLLEN